MLIHAECFLVGECHLCGLAASQRVKRRAVEQVQEKQAKKIVKDSQARLEPLQVGSNVTIPIPRIDRERTNPANLFGIVLNFNYDKCRIGTVVGLP